MTDGKGRVLAVELTAGQCHDSTQFEAVMDGVSIPQRRGRPRRRPKAASADKGYSYPRIRLWLRNHHIKDVIPRRDDQRKDPGQATGKFDRQLYRRRSVVEQCIGWLKECRRIGTRFEKLAISFRAMLQLAIIQQYLRAEFGH